MIKDIILTCKKEGDFTLHSGEKSSYLFDVMEIINDEFFQQAFINFTRRDMLVGIEFGGAMLVMLVDAPFGFVRKDGTIYGYVPDNYTLVDDVVTTENSIRKAIEQIGKKPKKIKTIIDRRKIKTLDIESMLRWEE